MLYESKILKIEVKAETFKLKDKDFLCGSINRGLCAEPTALPRGRAASVWEPAEAWGGRSAQWGDVNRL